MSLLNTVCYYGMNEGMGGDTMSEETEGARWLQAPAWMSRDVLLGREESWCIKKHGWKERLPKRGSWLGSSAHLYVGTAHKGTTKAQIRQKPAAV